MTKVIDLSADAAKAHFLKGSSYFNGDFPNYISFEPLLSEISKEIPDGTYLPFKKSDPSKNPNVNYRFITNKDGRFSWRPYELIHPLIYVSLFNTICSPTNWPKIVDRIASFQNDSIVCCSSPIQSNDSQSDKSAQISNWWQAVEQASIELSLTYSHVINTDVTDCYGSLYTHSISWALHGFENGKSKTDSQLGDEIDRIIRAGRFGQTNGIPQGSALMDFIAEIVLGYVDKLISIKTNNISDFRILRYRDDYRIFANSDRDAEYLLRCISDCLQNVGMRLNTSKTFASSNIVESSIKPDKLAGIDLQDLGVQNASTIQKQLLRLHAFGRRYPNSGALRRLLVHMHESIVTQSEAPPPPMSRFKLRSPQTSALYLHRHFLQWQGLSAT